MRDCSLTLTPGYTYTHCTVEWPLLLLVCSHLSLEITCAAEVFNTIDVNHDGYVSVDELQAGLDLHESDARLLMDLLDRDRDGRASLAEVAQLSLLWEEIADLRDELGVD